MIEAGSSSGATDLASFSVTATSATWSEVAARDGIYVRVKAVNAAGTGSPSRDVRIDMPDMRNIIEALFFNAGPYNYSNSVFARDPAARMNGFPAGSRVSVRVPHEVGGEQFATVAQAVDNLNTAMGGSSLFLERASLTIAQWDQQRPAGVTFLLGEGLCSRTPGSAADVACAINAPTPIFTTASIRMPEATTSPKVWTHELGHAVGLFHIFVKVRVNGISDVSLFTKDSPIMGVIGVATDTDSFGPVRVDPQFTDIELEAVRMVYASGLRPGATIGEFVARGLITP